MTEEALFLAALEKNSPIERQAFLDEACGADTLLRARVQLLLEADARVRGILDRPEPGDPEETGAYLPKEQSGTIIAGRYKLLEPIGEGGMGTVWVAEQTQPVRRKVALKLIKAGMDSKSVLARFEGERQALALMDHPNIAKVLDGGLTETSRPYFVMEYIKGIRITEFCDTARLSIPERLQLFAQVCQAVQHAHHKGIIHRDLKPSNILVAPYDDKPVPKIIDFGLAKAMHQSLTERTLHTAHETVLGTPLYMSPEQAQLNNLDVDTRSDIYSLGVLLYELLTGTTPLEKNRFKEAAWEEIRRLIREEEPPRPSTRLSSTNTLPSLAAGRQTDPAHLKKLMRGELDWIVMKSLEKDRSRRYETANGFALDIQRYLAGEPVLAVPPSRSYRLRKFVRKNRVALTTASVITSLVVAGVMGVLVVKLQANRDLTAKNTELADEQAKVIARNRELAEEQIKVEKRFELAQKAIAKLHSGVGEDLLLKSGQFKELRNQLLKEAGEFYGDMEKLLEGEVDPKSRSLLADGYFQLADLTDQIGSKPKALALHRKALEMRRNLAAAPGSDLKTQLDVARSLGAVGYILLFTGDLDGAMLNFREQHDTAAALAKDSPTEAVQVVVAQSLTRFAMVHRSKQRPSEASTETDMAAAILRKLSKVNPTSEGLQQELARTLEQSGKLLWEAGKWQQALANHDNAHVIWNKLASTHSDISRYQYSLGISDYYIGDTLLDVGKPAQALPSLRKAAAIAKNLADTYPAVTKFQIMLAFIQRDIGSALSDMGRSAEAKEALLQVMENCERIDKSDSSLVTLREPLGECYNTLGDVCVQLGNSAEALKFYEKLQSYFQKHAKADEAFSSQLNYLLARSLVKSGQLLRAGGNLKQALMNCQEALSLIEKINVNELPIAWLRIELASNLAGLGAVQRRMGQLKEAVRSIRRAIELVEQLPMLAPRDYFNLACYHSELAAIASNEASIITTEEGKAEVEQAMKSLHQAIAEGFTGIGRLKSAASLELLRPRADFQNLVKELEAKVSKLNGMSSPLREKK